MGLASIQGGRRNGALTGRTAIGLRFDRNCMLAGVAGRLLVAIAIDAKVEAIMVADTTFEVGPVANDIEVELPPGDATGQAMIIRGGTLAFGYAAGIHYGALTEGLSDEQVAQFAVANAVIAPAIANRSMLHLVRRLDRMTIPGKHRSLEWLKPWLKESQS